MTDQHRSEGPLQKAEGGPSFLNDLADDVVLISTVMKSPLHGREAVAGLVRAAGAQYVSKTTLTEGLVEGRGLLHYEATLTTGDVVEGTVLITRDPEGRVTDLLISHAPLDGAMALSRALGEVLTPDLDRSLFAA